MTEAILVAVLSLIGTFIGAFGGLRMTSYRIQQLEKKVDKHNRFAERMPVVEEQIKTLTHRVDEMEK